MGTVFKAVDSYRCDLPQPHRIVAMTITFTVEGDVPADAVGRAIALSHNKYCSVWHSMREDITFTTHYDVLP